jgi:hypothetical protein
MSGDGIAYLARRRRAMTNLEMQWWHTSDIADPPAWQRMQVYQPDARLRTSLRGW